jgi:hypothetical protein
MTTEPQRDLNNILGDMTMPVFRWLTLGVRIRNLGGGNNRRPVPRAVKWNVGAVQRLRRIPPCGS